MSSITISTILLVLSTFLLSSAQTISDTPLIREVCFNSGWDFDRSLCAQILGSDNQIASAKNMRDFSIAIIKAGEANATKTRSYIENELGKSKMDSNVKDKDALQECKLAYDLALASFQSALSEVVDDNDPQTATYDVLIGCTDNLKPCSDRMSKDKVEDDVIQSGSTALQIYGFSAYGALNRL